MGAGHGRVKSTWTHWAPLFQPFTMSSALILFAMLRSSAANTEVKWARKSGGGGCTHAQANAMNLVRVSVSLLRDEVCANLLDLRLGETASYIVK